MSKDIPIADFLEWCKERNYALVAREDFPYLFKDIVMCKDCKRSGTDGGNTFCMWLGALRKPTDFCSYGERRADEFI